MDWQVDVAVSIRVASDSPTEAELVRGLLEDDFSNLTVCVDMASALECVEPEKPGVLILAFKEIARAESFFRELIRLKPPQDRARQRVIALCTNAEVKAAYERCRSGLFDDYVMFWPVTHDTKRLPLAVHRATREVLGGQEDVKAPVENATGPPPEAARKPENSEPPALRPTVLVVDDDDFQRMLSGKVLQASGYQAEFAESGAVALRTLMLAKVYPDVILLDIQMPDMDGLEVLAQLKNAAQLAPIPVIMVSGNNEREIVVRALTLGAVDYIVKPFASQALTTKLVRALQRGGTAGGSVAPAP